MIQVFCSVLSAGIFGVKAYPVFVEADEGNGLPGFYMVGLLSSEIKEAKERVKSAIKNSGFSLGPRKITINLSPADRRKEGAIYDLPIAVAVLCVFGILKKEKVENVFFAGELSLDGSLRGIRGVLSMAVLAERSKVKKIVVPQENYNEASQIKGIEVIGVHSLREVVDLLNGTFDLPQKKHVELRCENKEMSYVDFGYIKGQMAVKRAVKVAVAGRHNILLVGNPGTGKTLIAKAIPGILPKLSQEESIVLTEIYSIAGELPREGMITSRPFRTVHHSITPVALGGGGRIPKPGEITMAHSGVLFMDEFPEFKRETINILREPMEDKRICISRKEGRVEYPADFMFVGAMNLCPCGYYPDLDRCNCSSEDINRYFSKIKGPIMDRIDICVEVSKVRIEQIQGKTHTSESGLIREDIIKAQRVQGKRYKKENFSFNALLDVSNIEKYCRLGKDEKNLISSFYESMNLSLRGYHRIIKVARTIADLESEENIRCEHLLEASAYRMFS